MTLHADAAAGSAGVVFSGWQQPDWAYWGCGPQAAQNVLNDYGVQMQDIAGHYIPTFAFAAGSDDGRLATSSVFVIDYPDNDKWRSKFDLGTELSWYSAIFSTISFGAGGLESNTVITIDYVW